MKYYNLSSKRTYIQTELNCSYLRKKTSRRENKLRKREMWWRSSSKVDFLISRGRGRIFEFFRLAMIHIDKTHSKTHKHSLHLTSLKSWNLINKYKMVASSYVYIFLLKIKSNLVESLMHSWRIVKKSIKNPNLICSTAIRADYIGFCFAALHLQWWRLFVWIALERDGKQYKINRNCKCSSTSLFKSV